MFTTTSWRAYPSFRCFVIQESAGFIALPMTFKPNSSSIPALYAPSGAGYGLGVSVLLDPARRGNLGSVGDFGLRAKFVTLPYQSIVGD